MTLFCLTCDFYFISFVPSHCPTLKNPAFLWVLDSLPPLSLHILVPINVKPNRRASRSGQMDGEPESPKEGACLR